MIPNPAADLLGAVQGVSGSPLGALLGALYLLRDGLRGLPGELLGPTLERSKLLKPLPDEHRVAPQCSSQLQQPVASSAGPLRSAVRMLGER